MSKIQNKPRMGDMKKCGEWMVGMLIVAACLASTQTFAGGKAGLPRFFGEIPPLRQWGDSMDVENGDLETSDEGGLSSAKEKSLIVEVFFL